MVNEYKRTFINSLNPREHPLKVFDKMMKSICNLLIFNDLRLSQLKFYRFYEQTIKLYLLVIYKSFSRSLTLFHVV